MFLKFSLQPWAYGTTLYVHPQCPPIWEIRNCSGTGNPEAEPKGRRSPVGRNQSSFEESAPPKSNINKEGRKIIKQLEEDKKRVILIAGKGDVMVVMDRKDYAQKVEELLGKNLTYKTIPKDPTIRQKTGSKTCIRTSK